MLDIDKQFALDVLDPEVYTPGKPPLTDDQGNLKFYKAYWFITTNDAAEIDMLSDSKLKSKYARMAEWLGESLQKIIHLFKSGCGL